MNAENKIYHWVVTGGAGFIGSHLVRELARRNQRVTVFDNFSAPGPEKPSDVGGRIRLIQGDVRDGSALTEALNGADFVLHHAALVSVPQSVEKPEETFQINIQGTANVLEAARARGVRRVIFASSSAVYGNGTDLPYQEIGRTDCRSPYAASKLSGEELCRKYTRVYGLETVCLRYFNVFGPGQNPYALYAAVIAKFLQCARDNKPFQIDWDGLQSRDFIHVSDVVQANLLVVFKAAPGEVYNVASGKTYTLLELAELTERVCGRRPGRVFGPKRTGDVRFSSADISKIKTLGFAPAVSLEKGLAGMWQSVAVEENVF